MADQPEEEQPPASSDLNAWTNAGRRLSDDVRGLRNMGNLNYWLNQPLAGDIQMGDAGVQVARGADGGMSFDLNRPGASLEIRRTQAGAAIGYQDFVSGDAVNFNNEDGHLSFGYYKGAFGTAINVAHSPSEIKIDMNGLPYNTRLNVQQLEGGVLRIGLASESLGAGFQVGDTPHGRTIEVHTGLTGKIHGYIDPSGHLRITDSPLHGLSRDINNSGREIRRNLFSEWTNTRDRLKQSELAVGGEIGSGSYLLNLNGQGARLNFDTQIQQWLISAEVGTNFSISKLFENSNGNDWFRREDMLSSAIGRLSVRSPDHSTIVELSSDAALERPTIAIARELAPGSGNVFTLVADRQHVGVRTNINEATLEASRHFNGTTSLAIVRQLFGGAADVGVEVDRQDSGNRYDINAFLRMQGEQRRRRQRP